MPAWHAYSFAFGPVMAVVGLGILVVVLRWAFGGKKSVVAAPARPGKPSDYGMLKPVASPATYIEGEMLRQRLAAAGITATLATTLDGPRVLVWPKDLPQARQLLSGSR